VPEKILSLSSLEGSNLVLMKMTAPASGCSLIIVGNCPHLEGWSVLQVSAVPYGKFQSLVIKMLSVLSYLKSKVIAK
jgi:hypothetical protein